MRWHAMPSW